MTKIKYATDVNGRKREVNGHTNSSERVIDSKPRAKKMTQALKKGQHRARRKHSRNVSLDSTSCHPKRNIADPDNDDKETNGWTRELVLPTDSNFVKGNV